MEEKKTHLPSEIKDMSLIINKPYIAYLFKKTQKIAQALYMVSEYFDTKEPLRETFRKNATSLLRAGGEFLRGELKDNEAQAHQLMSFYIEVQSAVEIAEAVGLVSSRNAQILKEQIALVLNEIEHHKEKKIQLSVDFMNVPSVEEYKRQDVLYKGHESVLEKKILTTPLVAQTPERKDVSRVLYNPKPTADSKAQRSVQIIALFKPGAELMIKDITTHLKDVSEKTVQRELLSLVARGILKKKGERRWSKYMLR